jgi:PIN domain nuclease of toxin-antitoxin system
MNYLLDTHILIWALISPKKLKINIRTVLTDGSNNIFVSSVSFWEIAMKYATGKLELDNAIPEDFIEISQQSGFLIKNLTPEEAATYYQLKATHHKDPFDRMLIWQAMHNNYTMISDDKMVMLYKADGLKLL